MVVYTSPALSFHPHQLIGQICPSAQSNLADENPHCTLNDQRCDEEFKGEMMILSTKLSYALIAKYFLVLQTLDIPPPPIRVNILKGLAKKPTTNIEGLWYRFSTN